ncbi:ATP-NAD kinase [Aulographum hederae CBS 113979]|uniref:ATP-NAD kinase n=1 Tax=Aulographum hederae CBS 113979 TaxID=1176131 RepID=A0A6G1GZ29_9PEZI|nr:ATP-NAD kinase [Aulographum hederae CBS 113979]
MKPIRVTLRLQASRRCFSSTPTRREIRDINELPARIHPSYIETRHNDLLSLQWPSPPRNILLTKKDKSPHVTASLLEYAQHIQSTYPGVNILLERHTAEEVHTSLPFPIYTGSPSLFQAKVDLVSTLGGDGTILHASSLFATTRRVPPVLSFSMGTLGFLGEWKFKEYKRAFREVYMSGASDAYSSTHGEAPTSLSSSGDQGGAEKATTTGWSSLRGKSMGSSRGARVLLRNRLKISLHDPSGSRLSSASSTKSLTPPALDANNSEPHPQEFSPETDLYAMNELLLHRGSSPHLTHITISISGRPLTTAIADGMIVSTPTGSTAYSLSSGGSIVHPLVSSLLLTPVCPRSLSFRPLVLPANTAVSLRLEEGTRGGRVELSVDGVRRPEGVGVGMEVRVCGEEIRGRGRRSVGSDGEEEEWGTGGVPSVVRAAVGGGEDEDHWVGGLNGLLKFNYPFGEEEGV